MRAKKLQVVRWFDNDGWKAITRLPDDKKRVYENITPSSLRRLSKLTTDHFTQVYPETFCVQIFIWRGDSNETPNR